MSGSERISPTAHYTAHVWYRAGLAPAALATAEGRVLFDALQPVMAVAGGLGLPTLEPYLLARHRALDRLLEQALTEHGISQVLELAAGLSARGWRFTRSHPEALRYVEADLPGMAARKRAALARAGQALAREGQDVRAPSGATPSGEATGRESLLVEALDVLQPAGPGSLEELVGSLDPERGLVVLSEGLLSYLSRGEVQRLWQRLAAVIGSFRAGVYLADVHLATDETALVAGFRRGLGLFVRGPVHTHFRDRQEALDALQAAGFSAPRVWRAAECSEDRRAAECSEDRRGQPADAGAPAAGRGGGGGVGRPIPGHVLEASRNPWP